MSSLASRQQLALLSAQCSQEGSEDEENVERSGVVPWVRIPPSPPTIVVLIDISSLFIFQPPDRPPQTAHDGEQEGEHSLRAVVGCRPKTLPPPMANLLGAA